MFWVWDKISASVISSVLMISSEEEDSDVELDSKRSEDDVHNASCFLMINTLLKSFSELIFDWDESIELRDNEFCEVDNQDFSNWIMNNWMTASTNALHHTN